MPYVGNVCNVFWPDNVLGLRRGVFFSGAVAQCCWSATQCVFMTPHHREKIPWLTLVPLSGFKGDVGVSAVRGWKMSCRWTHHDTQESVTSMTLLLTCIFSCIKLQVFMYMFSSLRGFFLYGEFCDVSNCILFLWSHVGDLDTHQKIWDYVAKST